MNCNGMISKPIAFKFFGAKLALDLSHFDFNWCMNNNRRQWPVFEWRKAFPSDTNANHSLNTYPVIKVASYTPSWWTHAHGHSNWANSATVNTVVTGSLWPLLLIKRCAADPCRDRPALDTLPKYTPHQWILRWPARFLKRTHLIKHQFVCKAWRRNILVP